MLIDEPKDSAILVENDGLRSTNVDQQFNSMLWKSYGNGCTATRWVHNKMKMQKYNVDANLMTISKEAMLSDETSRTIKLQGEVQGHLVTMLVDSGSSHCFVSDKFAHLLRGAQKALVPIRVRIANGSVLHCIKEFPQC